MKLIAALVVTLLRPLLGSAQAADRQEARVARFRNGRGGDGMWMIANCCFGGPDLKTLSVTAGKTLW